jgi:hypothetical protein
VTRSHPDFQLWPSVLRSVTSRAGTKWAQRSVREMVSRQSTGRSPHSRVHPTVTDPRIWRRSVVATWHDQTEAIQAMWLSILLGESWSDLTNRLEGSDRLKRWRELEPSLSSVGSLGDLASITAAGSDPAHSDLILGALVRIAATDGGDDPDAAVTVLHLLQPGLSLVRRRLLVAGIAEAGPLVVGQAMIQVRSFPWRRRTRAHAANILRDTAKLLSREFAPAWSGHEVLVDPQRWREVRDQALAHPLGADAWVLDEDFDLPGLVDWAVRAGVVDTQELGVLLDYAAQRARNGSAHARVATARGISVRTCKRHCAAALAGLRVAAPAFLSYCAGDNPRDYTAA